MSCIEMKRYIRISGLTITIAIAIALLIQNSSCLLVNTDTVVCAETGMRCPAGWTCTQEQDGCTQDGCGDGIKTQGEECDDGNVHDGDGCSPDCHIEVCGNGRPDPGEQCDDGNLIDGDGCSANCIAEVCGNGNVDRAMGEVCDDGNRISGDGCSSDCKSLEVCGNGIIDIALGEECEFDSKPFPKTPSDSPLCNSNCTLPRCGDKHLNKTYLIHLSGRPDYYEECDDGGDSATCDADCTFAKCGDGYINTDHEDCDPGTGEDTDSCDGDCTFPLCGDKHTNPEYVVPDDSGGHPEECDAGSNTAKCNGSGNFHGFGNCARPRCGDGYVNPQYKPPGAPREEECDPGNPLLGISRVDCIDTTQSCHPNCTCS